MKNNRTLRKTASYKGRQHNPKGSRVLARNLCTYIQTMHICKVKVQIRHSKNITKTCLKCRRAADI